MKRVLDLLKRSKTTTLATSSDGKPRASLVSYYVVAGDAIIFGTDTTSIKGKNLAQNKRISMSVYNEPELVTIDGTVETPSAGEIEEYIEKLLTDYPEMKEMIDNDPQKVYYKIVINTAYYADPRTGAMEAEIITN
jgi:uncharacterized pyridoxamine 5'-phosphate oxidase family protein